MGKEIALYDRVSVDSNDVSDYCSAVATESENEQVDVSGFNAGGTDEFLAGKRTQAITFTFFAGPEIHAILEPIHTERSLVEIEWQPAGLIDGTRETLSGMAQLLTYPPSAERGSPRTIEARFTPGDAGGLTWANPS